MKMRSFDIDNPLEMPEFLALDNGKVFAHGNTRLQDMYDENMCWWAFKENDYHWAIYLVPAKTETMEDIAKFAVAHGTKIFTDADIKHLVYCSEDVLELYNF